MALCVLILGCTSTVSTVRPAPPAHTAGPSPAKRGMAGPLTLYYWQAPTIINPHLSLGSKDLSASRITYEPLASFNGAGDLVPILAAEVPSLANGGVSPDGRSVTWNLRPDVRWADGQAFTADDVVFTWRFASDPDVSSTSAAAFAGIATVVAVDLLTVRVEFDDVRPDWSSAFTGVQGMIIPEHLFADTLDDADPAAAPANFAGQGTGPYHVTEYSAEDVLVIGNDAVTTTRILYEPNPYYRDPDKPAFASVELRGGGGDATVAATAVADGLFDFAWNTAVDEATFAAIEADGGAEVVQTFGAFTERIMLNFTDPNRETADGERSSLEHPHPFLTDKAVRQAIAQAVDRSTIAELYGRGGRATTNLVVSPASFASTATTDLYPFDLVAARARLDAAGWIDQDGDGVRERNGVELRLLFQTSVNVIRQQTQEIVRDALRSIGFDVELRNIDASVYLGPVTGTTSTRRHFYADLQEFAFSNKVPDPGAYLRSWTCGEVAAAANDWSLSNWARYCDPDYDKAFMATAALIEEQSRREALIGLNDHLVEDVALIPLVHLADVSVKRSSLAGLDVTPWDVEVWNIADWQRR